MCDLLFNFHFYKCVIAVGHSESLGLSLNNACDRVGTLEWYFWGDVIWKLSATLPQTRWRLHYLDECQSFTPPAMREVRKGWSAQATCICSKKWLMWQLHNQDQKVAHGRGLSVLSCQSGTVPVTPQALLLETWSFLKFSKYGLKLFLVFSACVHGLQACECSHVWNEYAGQG